MYADALNWFPSSVLTYSLNCLCCCFTVAVAVHTSYWRKAEGEKRSALLKPFRVRIHSVYVLLNLDGVLEGYSASSSSSLESNGDGEEAVGNSVTSGSGSGSGSGGPVKPFHNIIGEMSANAFAEIMKSEHSADPILPVTGAAMTSSAALAPVTGLPLLTISSASSGNNAAPISTATLTPDGGACSEDLLSLLRNGHIEVPSFMQPFKLAPGKVINRGSYFLTVSVQRARHLRDSVTALSLNPL